MQRPPELVPIPGCGVKALESSGKFRKKNGKKLAKIQQNSGKFCEFFQKSAKISAILKEKFEIREPNAFEMEIRKKETSYNRRIQSSVS